MDYRIVTLRMDDEGRFDDTPLRTLAREGGVSRVEALPVAGGEAPVLALLVAVGREAEETAAAPTAETPSRREPALGADALRERLAEDDRPVFDALLAWRRERSTRDDLPAYMVLGNRAVATLAATRPRDEDGLRAVPGIGPVKLERYGDDLLDLFARAEGAPACGAEAPADAG